MNSDCLSALQTCDQIIRLKIPNLLRLYLNPFVAQTCVALAEMVSAVWSGAHVEGRRPSFLANSGDEALSGAIKLARYAQNSRSGGEAASSGRSAFSPHVYLVDNGSRFSHFASTEVASEDSATLVTLEFIPETSMMTCAEFILRDEHVVGLEGILVLSPEATRRVQTDLDLRRGVLRFCSTGRSILIACMDRDRFADGPQNPDAELVPDVVVFDESFTRKQIPFGAFTSRRDLAEKWMVRGMANFHSTTFQPNSVSSMHFLKCLEGHSQAFFQGIQPALKLLLVDHNLLRDTFRNLFSPSLAKLISVAGYDQDDVTASGHYIRAGSHRVFDGVGGVACSLRGHNPTEWAGEIRELDGCEDLHWEIESRLEELTGLKHHVPAVSGASAVEHAIKLGLAAHPSRSLIVAFQGGFGGKTLVALTGTSKSFYRQHLEPAYNDVVYLDPFADDAVSRLEELAAATPIALIQLELIQGVGGVREIPALLLESIQEVRKQTGALLFVDEIQTGMFRTGSFVRSTDCSLEPDLLTIGKGISDMMVPFAITLYSDRVDKLLQSRQSSLTADLRKRCSFELGYRALLNTLRRADKDQISNQVVTAGQRFQQELNRQLSGLPVVREIRCYGLLIGIELNCRKSLLQRIGLNATQLYLLQMMKHATCPVLMGFCQYEPSILKFTPPLTVTEDEVAAVCRTIADTLRSSTVRLLFTAISALWRQRK